MDSAGTKHWTLRSGNAAFMLTASAGLVPDRAAIAESGGLTSYRALHAASLAIAELIRSKGIRPGERVGLMFERGMTSAAAYFGTLSCGAVAVPINEALKPRQIDYIVSHSGARLLLTGETMRERLQSISSDVPAVEIGSVADLPDAETDTVTPRTGGDVAHLIYTSGSTGMPKGVVVSHANVWAGADAVISYLGIDENDRIASLLPFSFDYGLNQLLCAAKTGATLIVERSPVPQRIVETLFYESITVLPAVPPLWLQLLTVKRFCEEAIPSLRVMTNTGGRVPTDAVRRLRTFQPQADLVLMYGLTEAFRSTYLPPDKVDRKPDSIGRAIPGAEILVLREDMTPCAPNEVGQLVHRGPTVTLGYWNNPEATAERFRSNPLRPAGTPDVERVVFSGDLVRMDDEGDIYFIGRRDTMIKSLGHRVSPDEVTDVLYASGEIVEAVVATEPDEMRGDAIVAYVVLTESGSLENLKRYAAKELPRYMQPGRYHTRDAIARTSSGKHDARAMAEPVGGA
jgi:amino acid adenylation domain-containing protein